MTRLKALLIKEFLQMQRDKAVIVMMIMIPVVQLLLFGFAINTDVKHLPTVVFDQSHSAESRDLLESFSASGYFDLDAHVNSFKEVNSLIDNGRAKVGIILPPDFAAQILARVQPETGARIMASVEPGQAAVLTSYMGAIRAVEK